jgi:methylmalonyl-CoA mutase N-terminal domain/subunit
LDELRAAARSQVPLMPLFIEAVDAHATLGEVCDTLREVFSVYRPVSAI